jgi:hypothetical protein
LCLLFGVASVAPPEELQVTARGGRSVVGPAGRLAPFGSNMTSAIRRLAEDGITTLGRSVLIVQQPL